jgi:hypothetical protein
MSHVFTPHQSITADTHTPHNHTHCHSLTHTPHPTSHIPHPSPTPRTSSPHHAVSAAFSPPLSPPPTTPSVSSVTVGDSTQDIDIMVTRTSGYLGVYVALQDPNNPSMLPTHTNYTWTVQPDSFEVLISHLE